MWTYTHTNELYHHGILGMKWGVRRYQPYPKGKHGKFLGQDRDDDIVIKKGATATRLQTGDKISESGQTYVSFNKLDTLEYATVTSSGEPGGLNVDMYDGSGRILTLKLAKDIIAPSYQKTMDAFVKTVDEIGVKRTSKEIHGLNDTNLSSLSRWERNDRKERAKEFIKDYKHLTVDECRDRAYISFVKTFMKDTTARRMFLDSLKKDGYNAVIDENDYSFGNGFTKAPMIVFDSSNLKTTKSTSITSKDADYFRDLYWNSDDPAYVKKHNSDTIKKWDKWAGTSDRGAY